MSVRALRNVAPISFARCPVHGQLVARDGEGRLLGKCSACAYESAYALSQLCRGEA